MTRTLRPSSNGRTPVAAKLTDNELTIKLVDKTDAEAKQLFLYLGVLLESLSHSELRKMGRAIGAALRP